MALRDMKDDGARLEQGEITFLIGGNLPEGLTRSMGRFLHVTERKKADVVGLANFFKRPADRHVTRQSLATIRRILEGGNGGVHSEAPGEGMTPSSVTSSMTGTVAMIFRIRVSPGFGIPRTNGPGASRHDLQFFSGAVEPRPALGLYVPGAPGHEASA